MDPNNLDLGIICEECGNDDAAWFLCSDCLIPDPDVIAGILARIDRTDPAEQLERVHRLYVGLGWADRLGSV